jgi:hypothetical protein
VSCLGKPCSRRCCRALSVQRRPQEAGPLHRAQAAAAAADRDGMVVVQQPGAFADADTAALGIGAELDTAPVGAAPYEEHECLARLAVTN